MAAFPFPLRFWPMGAQGTVARGRGFLLRREASGETGKGEKWMREEREEADIIAKGKKEHSVEICLAFSSLVTWAVCRSER